MNRQNYLAGLSMLAIAVAAPAHAWSATSDLVLWAENGTNIQQSGLIQKFEKENPQYKVKLTEYPWQVAHDKLVAAMASGQAPDVSLGEDQWVGEFAHLGLLEPLDNFKKQQNYQDKDFLPNSWSYYVGEDGKTYAAPSYTEARALFYRKDLFDAANIAAPPKTLDEMRTIGKKLTDGEHHFGLADQSGDLDLHFYSWFIYANGGDVYNANRTKCTLTDPKAVEALTFYKSLFDQNVIPKDPAKRVDTAHGFEEGYYAMAESGPWWLQLIPTEAPQINDKWAAAPLPAGATPISYGHPNSWLVPAEAKNKPAAEAWIKFMLTPENAVTWFEAAGLLPPARAAYDDPRLKSNANVQALLKAAENGTNSVHGVPNGQAITLEIIKMLSSVKDGHAEPSDAAAGACQRIDRLLKG
jgi:ABC-type glycerol-3-phosphate transport system substrate-binding protein